MPGMMSKRKGKEGEREVARRFRERFPHRTVKRNWQVVSGKGACDVEIVGLPFHHEVKRAKQPNIRAAFRQAQADCIDGNYPVAVTRADKDEWLVTMGLDSYLDLLEEFSW